MGTFIPNDGNDWTRLLTNVVCIQSRKITSLQRKIEQINDEIGRIERGEALIAGRGTAATARIRFLMRKRKEAAEDLSVLYKVFRDQALQLQGFMYTAGKRAGPEIN